MGFFTKICHYDARTRVCGIYKVFYFTNVLIHNVVWLCFIVEV